MKITKVTPWLIKAPRPFLDTADDSKNANRFKEYVFVEVSTDEGITGWGEITGTSASSKLYGTRFSGRTPIWGHGAQAQI